MVVLPHPILLACALFAAGLVAQQSVVIPAAYTTTDAISYEWIAGASRDLRQQTLIGASHLTSLVGHQITALELRRTAANETYQGGTTHLTIRLSYAPHQPLEGSDAFAANVGLGQVLVFDGDVTLPLSPPPTNATMAWSTDNVMRVEFDSPFLYVGGTLCLDITGQPVSGQNANWWMADAEFENVTGSVVDWGGGCGAYGGPTHEWSNIARRTLLPGGVARFFAFGPPNSVGLIVFGQRNPVPVPLWMLGLPAPVGCDLHLATLDLIAAAVFEPENEPGLLSRGGVADFRLKIPNSPQVLGLGMLTQWVELSQMATSNALAWTIATAPPSLDMALLEGHPQSPTGELSVHLAHVMRFEYQ